MDAKLKALLADPSKKMDAAELSYLAACFRRTMFSVLHERGTGHWGGAASAAELVTSLYFNRLRINPADPQWADRDRFILSKGHASVNLYTVLAARGFISPDLLPSDMPRPERQGAANSIDSKLFRYGPSPNSLVVHGTLKAVVALEPVRLYAEAVAVIDHNQRHLIVKQFLILVNHLRSLGLV